MKHSYTNSRFFVKKRTFKDAVIGSYTEHQNIDIAMKGLVVKCRDV